MTRKMKIYKNFLVFYLIEKEDKKTIEERKFDQLVP